MGLLVVAFPAAVASHFFFPGTWTFILCSVALIPLARLMGEATEVISHKLGSGLGGLMNASFGNAAELIIALAALRAGHLEVVKASITGAILGNLLLVLVSIPMGKNLTLEFSHMEVLGIGVGAVTLIALDGESNWLEGVMLLGVYAILGVTFYFIP